MNRRERSSFEDFGGGDDLPVQSVAPLPTIATDVLLPPMAMSNLLYEADTLGTVMPALQGVPIYDLAIFLVNATKYVSAMKNIGGNITKKTAHPPILSKDVVERSVRRPMTLPSAELFSFMAGRKGINHTIVREFEMTQFLTAVVHQLEYRGLKAEFSALYARDFRERMCIGVHVLDDTNVQQMLEMISLDDPSTPRRKYLRQTFNEAAATIAFAQSHKIELNGTTMRLNVTRREMPTFFFIDKAQNLINQFTRMFSATCQYVADRLRTGDLNIDLQQVQVAKMGLIAEIFEGDYPNKKEWEGIDIWDNFRMILKPVRPLSVDFLDFANYKPEDMARVQTAARAANALSDEFKRATDKELIAALDAHANLYGENGNTWDNVQRIHNANQTLGVCGKDTYYYSEVERARQVFGLEEVTPCIISERPNKAMIEKGAIFVGPSEDGEDIEKALNLHTIPSATLPVVFLWHVTRVGGALAQKPESKMLKEEAVIKYFKNRKDLSDMIIVSDIHTSMHEGVSVPSYTLTTLAGLYVNKLAATSGKKDVWILSKHARHGLFNPLDAQWLKRVKGELILRLYAEETKTYMIQMGLGGARVIFELADRRQRYITMPVKGAHSERTADENPSNIQQAFEDIEAYRQSREPRARIGPQITTISAVSTRHDGDDEELIFS